MAVPSAAVVRQGLTPVVAVQVVPRDLHSLVADRRAMVVLAGARAAVPGSGVETERVVPLPHLAVVPDQAAPPKTPVAEAKVQDRTVRRF